MALAWKAMNLSGYISLFFWLVSACLLLIANVFPNILIQQDSHASPVFFVRALGVEFAKGMPDALIYSFFGQADVLSNYIANMPDLAVWAVLLANLFFMAYSLCSAYLAYRFREYLWAAAIIFLSVLSIFYRYFKAKEFNAQKRDKDYI